MHNKLTDTERSIERLLFYLEQGGMEFFPRTSGDGLGTEDCYRGYPLTRLTSRCPIPAMLDRTKAWDVLRAWDKLIDEFRMQDA